MGVEEEPTGGGRGREGGRGRRGGNKAVEGQPDQQKHCEKTSLQTVSVCERRSPFYETGHCCCLDGSPWNHTAIPCSLRKWFSFAADTAHSGGQSLRNTSYLAFSLVLWCVFSSHANSGPDSRTSATSLLLLRQLCLR